MFCTNVAFGRGGGVQPERRMPEGPINCRVGPGGIDTKLCEGLVCAEVGRSRAKDRRPALDRLVRDATRRGFDVLICWRLDRLGRNLRHLVTLLDELHAVGVSFVSLGEGIDCTTPAGRLQLHVLAALAEFERGRIQERVRAGLARARRQGTRLGRPVAAIPSERIAEVAGLSVREGAARLGVSPSTLKRWRRRAGQQTLPARG